MISLTAIHMINEYLQVAPRHWKVLLTVWGFCYSVNKTIMLYIVIMRAMALSSVKRTINRRRKTFWQQLVEVLIFGFVGGTFHFLILWTNLNLSLIISKFLYAFVVALLAVYTLVKLHFHTSSTDSSCISGKSTLRVTVEYSKMVLIVTLVFCSSEILCAVAFLVKGKNEHSLLATNVTIFNSTVNLFIYIAVSREFR